MKKILLIHNTYRNLGGEDIAVASEVEVLKKHYDIKELYFSNLDTGYISLLMTLFFNRSLKSENVVRKAITEYSPDLIYVHNTWFNASLGIFRVLQNSKVPIFLKIHNFRYYCTKTLSFKKHLKNEEYCPACGLKNRRLKILNSYFENSLFKSLLMNRYGLGYFKIIKDFFKPKLSSADIIVPTQIFIFKKSSKETRLIFIL